MFFQGNKGYGKKFGNKEYLKTRYPNLKFKDYQNLVDNKATTIQSLFIRNKFRTYTKPILNDRINAKMVEKKKNLPTNTIVQYLTTPTLFI